MGRGRRVLLRRAAAPGRGIDAVAGALDRRAHPALRRRGARRPCPGAAAGILKAAALGLRAPAGTGAAGVALARRERRGASSPVAAARPPDEVSAESNARRRRVPVAIRYPLAVEAPRALSLRSRLRRPAVQPRLRAGRFGFTGLRRQLELARADLDAAQFSDYRVAIPVSQLLWRRVSSGVPGGFGTHAQPC